MKKMSQPKSLVELSLANVLAILGSNDFKDQALGLLKVRITYPNLGEVRLKPHRSP
jgi:hypothetical protein